MEKLLKELQYADVQRQTRRHFLQSAGFGLGALGLGSLLGSCGSSKAGDAAGASESLGGSGIPQFAPKAKRVIYIHMAGAPSQLELFDYKPELVKYHGKDCPAEFLEGKKFAFIQGVPKMLGATGEICTIWPIRCLAVGLPALFADCRRRDHFPEGHAHRPVQPRTCAATPAYG